MSFRVLPHGAERCRAHQAGRRRADAAVRRAVVLLTMMLGTAQAIVRDAEAQVASQPAAASASQPLKERHVGASRERATKYPRGEGDQAVVDGWPLYRTERGQAAFNDAMAALRATEGNAPAAAAFKGCTNLDCAITLPTAGADGWLPAGRIWVSPTEYVLLAHSPRLRSDQQYRRRPARGMRYFVFHEFHNSSRNTDLYDTISSHRSSVFVPFYMGKAATDAKGRRFVIVVQVAPYDVYSIHATNYASGGPGIEVARNAADPVEPLQNLAGILIASMVKTAAPHLRVVNHRGNEGLPMLNAYERRLNGISQRTGAAASVALPFVPAAPQKVAAATGTLNELFSGRGASPKIPVAQRAITPPTFARAGAASTPATPATAPPPVAETPILLQPPTLVQRPALVQAPALIEPVRRATPPPSVSR